MKELVMNVTAFAKWTGTVLLLLTLGACGGSDDGGAGTGPQPAGTVIGAAGGTVVGPNGATVVIPPGALSANTTITITQTSAGAPALSAGLFASGPMFAFTPHGTTFAVPATVTVPFDPAAVPAGATPMLFKTNATQTGWDPIAGATAGATSVTGQVTSFSTFVFGYVPHRLWSFWKFPADNSAMKLAAVPKQEFEAVVLNDAHDYGSHSFEFDGVVNGRATGRVFSSATGNSYSVLAESPEGQIGTADTAIGSLVELQQFKGFRKLDDKATLTLIVTAIRLEGFGFQPTDIIPFECLKDPLCKREMTASVEYEIEVYNASRTFQRDGHGQIELRHVGTTLKPTPQWEFVTSDYGSKTLWTKAKFRQIDTAGTNTEVTLIEPLRIPIDISSLGVEERFTVRIIAKAKTFNQAQGESFLLAYFRDPVQEGGGALEFTGLEVTNEALPLPPEDTFDQARECTTGTDPEAGVLQFSAATFAALELPIAGATPITVTRTGGSRGAVSVRFTTSDGTATAGSDYSPVSRTVSFADGETEPRAVEVPFVLDTIAEPDESVNLTLSSVRGCAALGAQTSAELTIVDNDRPLAQSAFSIGGTVTGVVGSGLVLRHSTTGENLATGNGPFTFLQPLPVGFTYNVSVGTQPGNPSQICTVTNGTGTMANANITNVAVDCVTPPANGALDPGFGSAGKVNTPFGGDDTAMALQADGKIIMVGGSGSDFLLARYDPNGSLDPTFGVGGLVTSDVGTGSSDEARAVAIQSDGKIVVVGNAVVGRTANNQFNFDFAVARFNVDGSLDASFGSGGKVTTDFNGQVDRAFAVAIQGDGKIVVVGSAGFSITSGISTDFAVARYNSNGTPDTSFGSGGKLTTDIGGAVDIAQNVVVQSNGAILVSGVLALGGDPTLGHGGLARYDGNGIPDSSFGSGGKLTLPNVALGDALAVQGDAKIVVAGSAVIGGAFQFALMRLSASGSPDGTFGSGGLVTTGFTTQDDFGRAVAIQADGRIVVAGQSSNKSNSDFAVARYGTNGALDASFGTGGKLTIDFFGSFDGAENVAVQSDGKIVVSGFARNGTRTGYGLVRILP
jgi:uncharacterized delta-60 repeat protein